MSVYKDPKTGKWEASFRVTDWTGKRKQIHKRGFARRADALEFERESLAKAGGRTAQMTFGNLVDLYMADSKTRLKLSTYENKQWIFNKKILPYFKDQYVEDISASSIRSWQNHLIKAQGKSGEAYSETYLKTINNQMSAVFNFAVRYYGLKQNPASVAGSMGSSSADEMQFWTLEEFQQFIAGMSDPTAYAAFNILYWTGIREGELLALTLADVDFEKKGLYVQHSYARIKGEDFVWDPKTRRSKRFVSAPDFLLEIIRDYVAKLYEYSPEDRLFEHTKYWLKQQLERCCQRTGVKIIRVHDVRHSHASLLISKMGANAVLVQKRLGHKKISTTLGTYAHLYPDYTESVTAQLEALGESIGEGTKKEEKP